MLRNALQRARNARARARGGRRPGGGAGDDADGNDDNPDDDSTVPQLPLSADVDSGQFQCGICMCDW